MMMRLRVTTNSSRMRRTMGKLTINKSSLVTSSKREKSRNLQTSYKENRPQEASSSRQSSSKSSQETRSMKTI